MNIQIDSGIEEVVARSQTGELMNLYYEEGENKVFYSDEYELNTALWVAAINTPIDEAGIRELVATVVRYVNMSKGMVVPKDTAQFTPEKVQEMYRCLEFSPERFDDFIMGCYMWKITAANRIRSGQTQQDGAPEATLYLGFDGNCYVLDDTLRTLVWYDDNIVRNKQMFFAIHLPAAFADESIYTIAAAVFAQFRAFRNALTCQRRYYE